MSISVWQQAQLSEHSCPWDTLTCGWAVKQPTNNNTSALYREVLQTGGERRGQWVVFAWCDHHGSLQGLHARCGWGLHWAHCQQLADIIPLGNQAQHCQQTLQMDRISLQKNTHKTTIFLKSQWSPTHLNIDNNNNNNNERISRAPFHVKHAQLHWTGANTQIQNTCI